MTPENSITLDVGFTPMLADLAVTGGRLALLMPDGRYLTLDGGADPLKRWLRLAVACLEAADNATPPIAARTPDWRWDVALPALAAILHATMDATTGDDLAMTAPTLALLAMALGQHIYRPTD
jgi:hypothetical protein